MTATLAAARRDVSVAELRRAWHALRAGEFRTPDMPDGAGRWQPGSGERVLPVLGCGGGCGASTVAVGLASAFGAQARVVECVGPASSGLAAAAYTELGAAGAGWTRGARGPILIDRPNCPVPRPGAAPVPAEPDDGSGAGVWLTVLDVGWPLPLLDGTPGWLAPIVGSVSALVVVASASVPGLRQLEVTAETVGVERVVAGLVGSTRRGWPSEVRHGLGPHARTLDDTDRLFAVPADRGLAVCGLDSRPLPASVVDAAGRLLHAAGLLAVGASA